MINLLFRRLAGKTSQPYGTLPFLTDAGVTAAAITGAGLVFGVDATMPLKEQFTNLAFCTVAAGAITSSITAGISNISVRGGAKDYMKKLAGGVAMTSAIALSPFALFEDRSDTPVDQLDARAAITAKATQQPATPYVCTSPQVGRNVHQAVLVCTGDKPRPSLIV